MFPSRHALGALVLERAGALLRSVTCNEEVQAGLALLREAEATYAADLLHYADNLWALVGRRNCIQLRLYLCKQSGQLYREIDLDEKELRTELSGVLRQAEMAMGHSSPFVREALRGADCDVDAGSAGGASCFCAGRGRKNNNY
jgi:hypothetical protein